MSKYMEALIWHDLLFNELDQECLSKGFDVPNKSKEIRETIREALTRMAEIEEGKSVVVPVEPTEAIRGAFYNEMRRQGYKTMDVVVIDEMSVYRAMIAAREGK